MPQTAYSINIPAVAYPGQLVDMGMKDILSALAVAAAIIYGTLVVTDESNTTDFSQLAGKAPAASGDVTGTGQVLGVAVANQALAQNPAVANPQYPLNYAVPCLRQGRVWVLAETGMTDGVAPFVRYALSASASSSYLGNFRNDADSTAGPVLHAAQLPATQAVVRGTTSAAGYAVIECAFV